MTMLYGKKGGSSSSSTTTEDPDTLKGAAKLTLVDWISEGPCVGFKDGKDFLLSDVALENPDGSVNFKGVEFTQRYGYPEQAYVPGVESVTSEYSVGIEVRADTPVTQPIRTVEADACNVVISFARLTESSGNSIHGVTMHLAIDVKPQGGVWTTAIDDQFTEKTTSTAKLQYRVPLDGTGPWDVRVRRITPDNTSSLRVDNMVWDSYAEVIYGKFTWPHVAYVVTTLDAQQFGTSVPSRAWRKYYGRIVKVPSNYNPDTREYTGTFWDGTFKDAWTDNPAWIAYDIVTNTRCGIGLAAVDKFTLYTIGKYCDELVDDGAGGKEPRYTLNTVITSRQSAVDVLSDIVSTFRGMFYWDGAELRFVHDAPASTEMLFSPANVVGGFTYQSSADTARYSVVNVTYNDATNNYKKDVVTYVRQDALAQIGWVTKDVTLYGGSSRSAALRYGRWIAYSDCEETERVQFIVGEADATARPGMIIGVLDPETMGPRLGGRIVSVTGRAIVVDALPEESVLRGKNWKLALRMPDGALHVQDVGVDAATATLTLTADLPAAPVPQTTWALYGDAVGPTLWRVLSMTTNDDGTYTINALEHHTNKYAEVEQGIHLDEIPTSLLPTGALGAPTGLSVVTYTELSGNQSVQSLTLSWTASTDARTQSYLISAKGPSDATFRVLGATDRVSYDVHDVAAGEWQFRVCAQAALSVSSPWVTYVTTIGNLILPLPPSRVEVTAGNRAIAVTAYSDSAVLQEFEFYLANAALETTQILSNARKVGQGTSVAVQGLTPGTTYFLYVRGTNAQGVSDFVPAQATTTNHFDEETAAAIARIEAEDGPLAKILESAKASAVAEVDKLVPEQVEAANKSLTQAFDDFKSLTFSPLADKVNAQGEAFQSFRDSVSVDMRAWAAQIAVIQASAEHTHAGIVTEEAARATADEALSTRVDTVSAAVDAAAASVRDETKARATADEALAGRVTTVEAGLGDEAAARKAAITDETAARQQQDEALAGRVTTVSTQLADTTAKLTDEVTTRAAADEALSNRITSMSSAYDGKITSVTQSVGTLSTKVDGLAYDNTQLRADMEGKTAQLDAQMKAQVADQYAQTMWLAVQDAHTASAAAGIYTEQTARTTDTSALATSVTQVSATVADLNATVRTEMKAEVDKLTGMMNSQYVISATTVNGKTAAFGLTNNGVTTDIGFVAENMWLMDPSNGTATYPWMYSGGRVMINTLMVGNGVVGGYLQSDSYAAGSAGAGWRLNKDGTAELNNVTVRGAVYASGGSFKGDVEANRFVCRYDNGVLAIEIGELS